MEVVNFQVVSINTVVMVVVVNLANMVVVEKEIIFVVGMVEKVVHVIIKVIKMVVLVEMAIGDVEDNQMDNVEILDASCIVVQTLVEIQRVIEDKIIIDIKVDLIN